MSDVIVVMKDGRIQQQGDPIELYERPVNRFVANFIGVSNPIEGSTAIRGRIKQGTYLGDQTEYRIETAEAGELVVRQQNALGASTGRGIGPGDPVAVRWFEEANLVLVG